MLARVSRQLTSAKFSTNAMPFRLTADNVGSCVAGADDVGRQTWLLILLTYCFLPFFSAKLWHFVVKFPTLSLDVVLSSLRSNTIDFSCVDFSLLVSMPMIATRAVSLLKFCVFFIFVYSIKIRRKDKYCFFSKFFADGCRASMSANVVGRHCWPPKRQPTMLARVSRAIAIPRSEKTNQKTEMTPTANPVQWCSPTGDGWSSLIVHVCLLPWQSE